MKAYILSLVYFCLFACAPALADQRIVSADILEGQNSGKEYLKAKGHFEKNVNGVTAYADAAGIVPVDGTGGSPTLTCTRTTSSPISGDGSLLITKDAVNRQGEGCGIAFTIDSTDKAKVMQIEFDYLVGSGTFVAGTTSTDSDLIVDVYDVTNAVMIEPSTKKLFSNSTTLTNRYVANFQTSSSSTSYRLIIHAASTSASAYTVKIDDMKVFRSKYVYGTPITDWTTYTPTSSWVSGVNTPTGKWRRVGDTMEVQNAITATGGVTAATLTFTIPSGYTIDTTKLNSAATATASLGYGRISDSGTGQGAAVVTYNSTTVITVQYLKASSASDNDMIGNVGATAPQTFASGDAVEVFYRIPITGWSSSVQMSDSADTRVVAAQFRNTAGTTLGAIAVIPFVVTTFDTHSASSGTGTSWVYTVPVAGKYKISATMLTQSVAWSATNSIGMDVVVNGVFSASLGRKYIDAAVTSAQSLSGSVLIDVTAGQTIALRMSAGQAVGLDTTTGYNVLTIERVTGPSAIAATETIAAVVHKAASNQTMTTNNSGQQVTFSTALFDTHGIFVDSDDSFTIPAPGIYEISAYITFTGANVLAARYLLRLMKGATYGAATEIARLDEKSLVASAQQALSGKTQYRLLAGEKLYLESFGAGNNSASNHVIDGTSSITRFEIRRIGL